MNVLLVVRSTSNTILAELPGRSFGAPPPAGGELVFQTGMVGYPESLTDPSYAGQLLVLTYPLVGNYGVPDVGVLDANNIPVNVESWRVHVRGLVVGEYDARPSHYAAVQSLGDWLAANDVAAVQGVDTRALTLLIREHGVLYGDVLPAGCAVPPQLPVQDDFLARAVTRRFVRALDREGGNAATVVMPRNPAQTESERDAALTYVHMYGSEAAGTRVLVLDCGLKHSQLRMLLRYPDVALVVVPLHTVAETPGFLLDVFVHFACDRLFVTNGPGDPARERDVLAPFIAAHPRAPIFGVCLGHQLLALANGMQTERLPYGNRGHNIPCQLIGTQRVFVTAQNHGYCVRADSERATELFRNLNDGTNEGLVYRDAPWFSVQFHPEACAGPEDTGGLFGLFLALRPGDVVTPAAVAAALGAPPAASLPPVPRRRKVLVLGSGGLCIGQSGEFDYSGSQAIKAFKEAGLTTVLVNPNIATVQTSPDAVDSLYMLPVTPPYVASVIERERPDCIALSFGGQTALNCGAELWRRGVLQRFDVEVLGTPVRSVMLTEDREAFAQHVVGIGERTPPGAIARSVDEALGKADELGYPVLVRAAFALGGLGSGFADDPEELHALASKALANSEQITLDKSLRGWKEVEYEVVRDRFDNCVTVCNMENLDPLGIHTGESIVVAPSQTLSDREYQMLRSASLRIVRSLDIVGECNVQYALDPRSEAYYVIEVNARLSRSSALASKATGYPLAYVAARLALGEHLGEMRNPATGATSACFEPSLDYCVVKVPRWDLAKFERADHRIGSAMKSVGEGMAIGRGFEEALQAALRMTGAHPLGLCPPDLDDPEELDAALSCPTPSRILHLAAALYSGSHTEEQLHARTGVDLWFLRRVHRVMRMLRRLRGATGELDAATLLRAKRLGFSDEYLAAALQTTPFAVMGLRQAHGIRPDAKKIDTVAGEFPCRTNYLYTTYATARPGPAPESRAPESVVVLGSGVYRIGSSVEFDCCAVSCARRLRALGKRVVMVNCNPETVSTDHDEADALYFCEVSLEAVLDVCARENATGVVISVGGQQPNNIAMALHRHNVPVLGTSPLSVDRAENRFHFSRLLDSLGVDQPEWRELTSVAEAKAFCARVGYPCLVRPSYVLSGAAMNVAYSDADLERYLGRAVRVSRDHPVVISKFVRDAKEIEVDAVGCRGQLVAMAISEHVENAGVHSGDATLVYPPQDLTPLTTQRIVASARAICNALACNGPFNIQFIAKDDRVLVIECNLRVSRSFPFVSKTSGVDLVALATDVMVLDPGAPPLPPIELSPKNVGVKVPQFSFERLDKADILMGVEMRSTGEVACYGTGHVRAFHRAMVASGFRFPEPSAHVLLSVGGYQLKRELRDAVRWLAALGFRLIGTHNTASYYGIPEMRVQSDGSHDTLLDWLRARRFQLVINLTEPNKMRSDDDAPTTGYLLRRTAVDANVPVVTDVKRAKLIARVLAWLQDHPEERDPQLAPIDTRVDRLAHRALVRIPGLFDCHVHVREPGATEREDWASCSAAALAGGITTIAAMPNTSPALTDAASFQLVDALAAGKSRCDYVLIAGASPTNADSAAAQLAGSCPALKMYLNCTHGDLVMANRVELWRRHIEAWPRDRVLCVHAEEETLAAVLYLAGLARRGLHVCHVSKRSEIELVRAAKRAGQPVTCEVAPHHLFLTADDVPPRLRQVRPSLGTADDRDALWANLDVIDCFATDHAPHLRHHKVEEGCPGYPGLETALPLLLTAVSQKRLTIDDVVARYSTNPRRIFGLPDPEPDTYVEVDMGARWRIPERPAHSKCDWTPFAGLECTGAVRSVVVRGQLAYIADRPGSGKVLARPGLGRNAFCALTAPATPTRALPDALPPRRPSGAPVSFRGGLISVEELTRESLRAVFECADLVAAGKHSPGLLAGRTVVLLFYEASTRTRLSFEAAVRRLGGTPVFVSAETSSARKGESLEDSARSVVLAGGADCIVLRHPEPLAAQRVRACVSVPVINAGDGGNEHPTQTLIDLYTVRQEVGTVGGLTVTIVGDARHSRTVHSLVKALCLRSNTRLHFASPCETFDPAPELLQYAEERGVQHIVTRSLTAPVLEKTDVLYVTRTQTERHASTPDPGAIISVTPATLAKAKSDVCVLHALPRGEELSAQLDSDPRAAYFRQMSNGITVRTALLQLVFAAK